MRITHAEIDFFFLSPDFPLFLISLKSWLGKHFKLRFKAIAYKNVLRSHWLQCHYVQMSGWSLDFVLGKKKKKSSTQQQAVLHEHALKSAFMRFAQKVKWDSALGWVTCVLSWKMTQYSTAEQVTRMTCIFKTVVRPPSQVWRRSTYQPGVPVPVRPLLRWNKNS